MKTCPHCAEEVQDAARKCKHCQSEIAETAQKKPKVNGSPFMSPKELWEIKGLRITLLVFYFMAVFSIWGSAPVWGLLLIVIPVWLIPEENKPSTWKERLKNWKGHKARTGTSILVVFMTLIMLIPTTSEPASEIILEDVPTVSEEIPVQKTIEELEEDRIRAQEEAQREQEERDAIASIESQIVIIEEQDISYIYCNRIAVRVTVPDDAPQKYVDRILNSWKYDYDNDDVTIWAWNVSETSQVGKISATRGTYERSTCDD